MSRPLFLAKRHFECIVFSQLVFRDTNYIGRW